MITEIIILSEVSQTDKETNIVYIWNLKKNDTIEFTYKTEKYPHTQKTTYGCMYVY